MALSKRTLRWNLARMIGDDLRVTADDTFGLDPQVIYVHKLTVGTDDQYNNYYRGWWLISITGSNNWYYRQVADYGTSLGLASLDWNVPLPNSPVVNDQFELHFINPTLYTVALNEALRMIAPYVFKITLNSSLTYVRDQMQYTLPSGISADEVRKVAIEGNDQWASEPYWDREDISFSPDGTKLWLGRQDIHKFFTITPGKIIYLFCQQMLTLLDYDDEDTLTNDDVDKVELVEGTNEFELFMELARARLYKLLSVQPYYQFEAKEKYKALAKQFMQVFKQRTTTLRMQPLESIWTV